MRTGLSAVVILLALLDTWLGFRFLTQTATIGQEFGLASPGAQGLSSMRADFTAFFWVAAGFMAFGVWRKAGGAFVAPLLLFLIAITGRALNLALVGAYPMWWQPMAVEGLHVVVLASAIRVFGWRSAQTTPA